MATSKARVQRMSKMGLALLSEYEGSRLVSYRDSAGFPTIGVGHLITDVDRFAWQHLRDSKGRYHITEAKMLELLADDLDMVERAVSSRKGALWRNANMLDSTLSFLFNLGRGRLSQPWLLRFIETEDLRIAEEHWPRWNKAGGKVVRGLTIRRHNERRQRLAAVIYR
jgi:lysozyme